MTAAVELPIRRMRAEDVEAVVAIEAASFTSPWQADTFETLLERPGAELWVMDGGGQGIVGYAVVWCILDQGEIANIAIVDHHRGRGHGRRLLARMLDVARERGVATMYLEVRVSNAPAIALYHSFGFAEVGTRPDYYDSPREDAVLMMARL